MQKVLVVEVTLNENDIPANHKRSYEIANLFNGIDGGQVCATLKTSVRDVLPSDDADSAV